MVRLYRGLRQYRETEALLHVLYKHHRFEMLLDQRSAATESGNVELKLVTELARFACFDCVSIFYFLSSMTRMIMKAYVRRFMTFW